MQVDLHQEAPNMQHHMDCEQQAQHVPACTELQAPAAGHQPSVVYNTVYTCYQEGAASMQEQRCIGNGTWAVTSTSDSNSVQQDIEQLKLETAAHRQRLSQLETRLARSAAEDAGVWGPPFIHDCASQALLFACGNQSQLPGKSQRFVNMSKAGDSRFSAFASKMPVPTQAQLLAPMLDDIISCSNSSLHFEVEAQLFEEAIKPAQKLLVKYPALGDACKQEALVINNYKEQREAFDF